MTICLFSALYTQAQDNHKGEKEPTKPEETEFYEPVPPTVTPATKDKAPSDATVLFDGKNLDAWVSTKSGSKASWTLNRDGSMSVKPGAGDIQTKKSFGDVQLHIEWRSPEKIEGDGQNRGNSGIFLQDRYEIQVLDNNDNDTYVNGQVGAVYKQFVPLAKASVKTGDWNTYDIIYHAPEFDEAGNKTKPATVTVLHNGILVQDHVLIKGTTEYIGWPKNDPHGEGPIRLQDHGSAVSYRNIWIREL
ncbi:protein of unknown function [Sinomicrobium oceani]|uniref:3-keto-alpha-glucoside-1,2-lyase/3-keto-2-hydroxy-glucal hydratase domain-containing protein n=2 Tax=Sinomicrobium oceani TaxID=1150368 RepID=A0A1K1NZJ2_9FLAO|nr:DUF1080 domain-containing protein [Sinomicrobium oceani]SFW40946.1 protein of unknown function [Sinomicrobium oceani]